MDEATRNRGLVVPTMEVPWAPLAEGVRMKVLHVGDEHPTWTVMIELEPGERLPAHVHHDASEFLILEGSGYHPAVGDFKQGDYVYEYAGAFHPPSQYHELTRLLMVSYGACSMLDEEGNIDYVLDAALLRKQIAPAAQG